jgi:hypothetical protein
MPAIIRFFGLNAGVNEVARLESKAMSYFCMNRCHVRQTFLSAGLGGFPAAGPNTGLESPMPLGFQRRHPGGMADNSPAFQRWDRGSGVPSPEGTAESHQLSRPCGTQPSIRQHPALKRRAILKSPSGTKTRPPCGTYSSNPSGIGPPGLPVPGAFQLQGFRLRAPPECWPSEQAATGRSESCPTRSCPYSEARPNRSLHPFAAFDRAGEFLYDDPAFYD